MRHYLYKITNTINGHFYIGVHTHKNPNRQDKYMGSGSRLHAAYRKYGKEFFKKEILEYFENVENMLIREAEIVNEEFINRKDTYNIQLGGSISFQCNGSTPVKDKDGNCFRILKTDPRWISGEVESIWKNKHHTEETKRKLSKAAKHEDFSKEEEAAWRKRLSDSQKGKVGPNIGKKWIHNQELQKNKMVLEVEFKSWFEKGWEEGFKFFNYKKPSGMKRGKYKKRVNK